MGTIFSKENSNSPSAESKLNQFSPAGELKGLKTDLGEEGVMLRVKWDVAFVGGAFCLLPLALTWGKWLASWNYGTEI